MKTLKKENMSCDEARSMMFEYLDGELGSRDALNLASHISECPDCQNELESCRKLLDEIGKIEYPVPDRLHSNVMALVGGTVQDRPSRLKRILGIGGGGRGMAAFGTLAAACAVIALVILNRGYIERSGGADLAAPELAQDVMYELDKDGKNYSTETVDALKFASPMTSAEETVPETGLAAGAAPSASGDDSYGYSDTVNETGAEREYITDAPESPDATYNDVIRLLDESEQLMDAIDGWLNAGTAVLVFNSKETPVFPDGEVIRVAGFETLSFCEIISSDADEKLTEIISLCEAKGEKYQSFVPESDYDTLVVAYYPEGSIMVEEASE